MGADLTFCHKVRSEHRYELQIRYTLFDTNNIYAEIAFLERKVCDAQLTKSLNAPLII